MNARRCYWVIAAIFFCALTARLWAGGSGLNLVIVVNQNSTNSVQLGNYYREKRDVPPQNFLRITNWTGGTNAWTTSDFRTYLFNPLTAMLSGSGLSNQIDYVLLSMDIPYHVSQSGSTTDNGTTSTLFYGFKPDTTALNQCPTAPGSTSLYAGSEDLFRSTPPISATSNSFLVTMLTARDLATAKMVVDQGVSSDSTFPTRTVYLAKSDDPLRNVRYQTFDSAIFNTRLRGNYSMQRILARSLGGLSYILGGESGYFWYSIGGTSFAPGAMADNLTSYGGLIFEGTGGGHLNILDFLQMGASGTYGTIAEPCNGLHKFPSTQVYFYQARGFSLAECYYLGLTNPYQGILLGEPLAAPFAQPCSGAWNNLPLNAVLSGSTNLSLRLTPADANHPLQRVDVFLDGALLQTLTNIAPRQNNILNVQINGTLATYTVPASATIKSVTTGLTAAINGKSSTTKVTATAHGDRIELISTDSTKPGPQVTLSVSNGMGSATALTTFVSASGAGFLDTVACGGRTWTVTGNPSLNNWLQLVVTKTNGTQVAVGVTNTSGSMTLPQMMQALLDLVNTNTPGLQAADGLTGQDVRQTASSPQQVKFNLFANAPGWNVATQLKAVLNGSSAFTRSPSTASALNQNVSDLEPRAHLYVTAGATNTWPLTFGFNTSTQANGFHELTAVAYEGSHVRTQKRVSQTVRIQNDPLSATLNLLSGASNTILGLPLQFAVAANTNNVSKIELFSTGGLLAGSTGQSNATFSIASAYLGLGLHPFYAVVTASSGKEYRTETKWVRLVSVPPFAEPPFSLSVTGRPPVLAWPATAGRSYDILSATNLANSFQVRAGVIPTNSPARWTETDATAPRRFYRIRTSN